MAVIEPVLEACYLVEIAFLKEFLCRKVLVVNNSI